MRPHPFQSDHTVWSDGSGIIFPVADTTGLEGGNRVTIIIGAIGIVMFLGLAASIPATLIVEREREIEDGEQT